MATSAAERGSGALSIRARTEPRPWGTRARFARRADYGGERWLLREGASLEVASLDDGPRDRSLYVHAGAVRIGRETLGPGEVLHLPAAAPVTLRARTESVLFVASAPIVGSTGSFAIQKRARPYDRFERYWGSIETVANNGLYSAKVMVFEAGRANSLHFHCRKVETFWVESGRVRMRLRDRFAEDRHVDLAPGRAIHLPPGLMHQFQAIERSVIFEAASATEDDDSDSFRVEKGPGFKMDAHSHPILKGQE